MFSQTFKQPRSLYSEMDYHCFFNLLIGIFFFFIKCTPVHTPVRVHVHLGASSCHGLQVEVRGQLVGVSSSRPPCGVGS